MLKGKNFSIRYVIESDLEPLLEKMSNLEVWGDYLPGRMTVPHDFRKRFHENGLVTEDFEHLLIVDTGNNPLGLLWHFKGVPYFDAREIGYTLLDMQSRKKGITSQAVILLSDYLFRTTQINRLEIRMHVENVASEKVALKSGYTFEGISRGATFVQGRFVDMKVYALLRNTMRKSV